MRVIEDTEAPEIRFDSDTIVVSVADGDEALLAGVTAVDGVEGDVTDHVIVEKISAMTDKMERTVTYVVMDESMNVARKSRTLSYMDYEKPQIQMTESLCFPIGTTPNIAGVLGAESSLDGDLSHMLKYSMEDGLDISKVGYYPITIRVADSAGQMAVLDTELHMVDRWMMIQEVALTDYLVYHEKGKAFSPEKYLVPHEYEAEIVISSNVDVNTPGVYSVEYMLTVVQGMVGGLGRLIVVVE